MKGIMFKTRTAYTVPILIWQEEGGEGICINHLQPAVPAARNRLKPQACARLRKAFRFSMRYSSL